MFLSNSDIKDFTSSAFKPPRLLCFATACVPGFWFCPAFDSNQSVGQLLMGFRENFVPFPRMEAYLQKILQGTLLILLKSLVSYDQTERRGIVRKVCSFLRMSQNLTKALASNLDVFMAGFEYNLLPKSVDNIVVLFSSPSIIQRVANSQDVAILENGTTFVPFRSHS